MAVFWSYFRDFVGAQKIEDLSESKNFFAEVFQIKSRFVLAKKNLGGYVHFKISVEFSKLQLKDEAWNLSVLSELRVANSSLRLGMLVNDRAQPFKSSVFPHS